MKPTALGPRQVHLTWWPDGPPALDHADRDEIDHVHLAGRLRSRPGVWAELEGVSGMYAHSIRAGRIAAYRPGGSFEALGQGGVLYARYVGQEGTASAPHAAGGDDR